MSTLINALRSRTKKKGKTTSTTKKTATSRLRERIKQGKAHRMTPADYGDDKPNKTSEALRLAGVMADRALALVGGRGVNGRVQGASLPDLSRASDALRAATEEYNDYIVNMT